MSTPNDSWKTPELRAAEAQVDNRLTEARELAARLQAQQLPPLPPIDTAAIARQVEEAAGKRDAPEHLKALKRKVDAGEFSWEDVVSGKAAADPDVQAAQQANMRQMQQAFQMLQEGMTADDILEAQKPRRARDDDDEGGSDFREDAW
ncbi:hypothetical protein Lesp02_28660 [Lentzea sp. NBRC 105346]|uniref:hypothetical protein n=1 Tax=Lentzea sp. NBRC 105346 TaxID=3032205 RepID=UPI00255459A3|nr:hypothetical protein [Lentzea sp. NBRC 105346]GLZ30677.1 hypothetical protein Lesp02_28660 [Lentzea sp. NBRC 105346]